MNSVLFWLTLGWALWLLFANRRLKSGLAAKIDEITLLSEEKRLLAERFEVLRGELETLGVRYAALSKENTQLSSRVTSLQRYEGIEDAQKYAEAERRRADELTARALAAAKAALAKAAADIKEKRVAAERKAAEQLTEAQGTLRFASQEAERILAAAKSRATDIAGDAYAAKDRAREYEATATAMKGVIHGYGDEYLVPVSSLLDGLAEDFSHTEAGANLRRARDASRELIRSDLAAVCDYVEPARREAAVHFVVDAFNGKVDSILTRVKSDNFGTLKQEVVGAFHLVNHNGIAFRNARIRDAYLHARLAELQWACTAQALRDAEREEQRALRERMREEERARKEYERAIKEAAQEEAAVKRAMEKVEAQVARASEAQRVEFEARLTELRLKLKEAEEKNVRALSMAQQTRAGHVYVISNIGSFGEEVFKIGMTRRLEPLDRVRELGDASVPFEFDIHAMIYSDDAPALERQLHMRFLHAQVNKVNPRKEFFRLMLGHVRDYVDALGIPAHWTMAAEAHSYRETQAIEARMKSDPQAARDWTAKQVEAELAEEQEEEAVAVA